ncbi:glycosyltransferase family 4 protein, partial [candidate division WOR-3 bacterium]|nr:glycosyltransferase family 4 protein [candidate division WOR-3 bacterium]
TTLSNFYAFWQRYLTVFDRVRVLSRVVRVPRAADTWRQVTGDGVEVLPVPSYLGPLQYVYRSPQLLAAAHAATRTQGATILRSPGGVAVSLRILLEALRRCYAVEVVGDPALAFSPTAYDHPFRFVFQIALTRELQSECRRACAVSYVTEYTLQSRYPPSSDAYVTHYSSVALGPEAYAAAPRSVGAFPVSLRVVSVGSMQRSYKGFDDLIQAVSLARRRGLAMELSLVGSGRNQESFERFARESGQPVSFLGELPGAEAVREVLGKSHLFVLVSRSEGLPRVMLEAMAQALPCIGTDVGGTREILPAEYVVPIGDSIALADKLVEVARDPDRLARMSEENLRRARRFADEVLMKRRVAFYRAVADATAGAGCERDAGARS